MRAQLKCPTCRKPVGEPGEGEPLGPFPFCSERCKLIDLGRWLDGKYQIPVDDPERSDVDANDPGVDPPAGAL